MSGIGPYRSSTIYILFRIWAIPTFLITLPTIGGNTADYIGGVYAVGMLVAFCMCWSLPLASLLMRVIGPFFWGDNWHYFRQSGGRPLLDALPWPFNPQPYSVRVGGKPEPKYKGGFKPPPSWDHQCPSCGALVEGQFVICWHCNADWINGNGEGSTFVDPHQIKTSPIDRAMGVDREVVPEYTDTFDVEAAKVAKKSGPLRIEEGAVVYEDEQGSYCVDESGCLYWFYENGDPYYIGSKLKGKTKGSSDRQDEVSDPSIVPMSKKRRK